MLRTIKLKVGTLKLEFQFCNWPWPWLGANHLTSQEPNLLTSWMSVWCLVFTRLFPALHIYKDPTVPSTTALPTHTAHLSAFSTVTTSCAHTPPPHAPCWVSAPSVWWGIWQNPLSQSTSTTGPGTLLKSPPTSCPTSYLLNSFKKFLKIFSS